MPLDTSIPLQVRGPEFQDPMAIQAKRMQLADLMGQQQMRQMQMEDAKRQRQEQQTLADLYRESGGDAVKTRGLLAQRGFGAKIPEFDKAQATIEKERAGVDKVKLENAKVKLEAAGGALSSLLANPNVQPQDVIRTVQGLVQQGFMAPEDGAQFVRTLPPDSGSLRALLMQHGMKVMDASKRIDLMLPKAGNIDAGNRVIPTQTNQLTGQVTQGAPIIKAPEGFIVGPDGRLSADPGYVAAKQSIARAGASTVSINTGQKGLDNEFKLRGEFKQEPVYKAHQEMQAAHGQIKQAIDQASPAGDLAAATKIMKLLDPGSVVRESELGMAMKASGLLDRVTNYGNMVITGQKLTPTQRKDFATLADRLMGESVKAYNGKRNEYEKLGGEYGLNATRALGPGAPDVVAPAKASAVPDDIAAILKKHGGK